RKIDAGDAEAEAEPADHRAERRGDRGGGEDAEPRPDPELDPQQRAHIAAKPDVERMPERELAGKAHHQVPGLPDKGKVEHQDHNRDEIAVGDERQRREDREHHDEQRAAAPSERAGHAHRPIMPCGRSTSTRIKSANDTMLFIDGAINSPASASDTPIRMPPTSAPAIEPRPPRMTMMKAINV